MAGYIGVPIETDPDLLSEEALDTLMSNIPGFIPREGHLEVWVIEVMARMVAEARDVASNVPMAIFRYFGESLMGLPPVAAAAAQTTTTWTTVDLRGYTIPAGTLVAFRASGDELLPFQTVEDVTIPPGSDTLEDVIIEALDPGVEMNDLGPDGLELIDALSSVVSVEATAATAGGIDEEEEDAYLDRLTSELQLLAPRPILAEDFAILARRTTGVHRALGVNMYDPDTDTYDNERTVTVAVVAEDGSDLPQAVKDEVDAYLEDLREVNFLVHVTGPSYTPLTVAFEAVAFSDADPATVQAEAVDAVENFLDPGVWGGGDQSPPVWGEDRTVRYLELAAVLNGVNGLNYLTTLTLNGGTSDVTMDGVAPLPATTDAADPTIITGTVNAP